MRPLLLPVLLASVAAAQSPPPRDVVVDGRSVVGRWEAVAVVGDPTATADLWRGTLTVVLVVNPTGHVILRGTDRSAGRGQPAAYSGRLAGDRVWLRGLPGEGRVRVVGGRLHLADPEGRVTVFVRGRRAP